MQAQTSTTLPAARGGLIPGFSDPVNDAQTTFRAALKALAHPGRVEEITAQCGVPTGLSPAMTALLLTLVDGDTPLWLPPEVSADALAFLRFHCGCPIVPSPSLARFAAVPMGCDAPALSACHPGDPAYPDLSTTLLLEVGSLADGHAVSLTGPGIQTRQALSVTGLPEGFWRDWRLNHQLFPLGVDVFLTQDRRMCGLPRTTRVEN
ncbi:phosphonate C-P lyase system protein PhnH [Achromobacter sp. JUb104]|uniref:phosphonate C-P lyase system protein PhnH n=1 Tax=Achromobacter sp. JUb104 TaxID=2940590 RepID=UPI00216899B2|nr:phosphonate C-P lyase system protein PhnH [Achromobacter sp. JUb104]MCS3506769.1 alpha-D-ribose 1-methylphosphonate 5-triphosphate synthase subunit PhnH [Achromobacter sp. JUb104]